MYKRFSIIVVIIISLGTIFALLGVNMRNEASWKEYHNAFAQTKDNQVELYFDMLKNDLEDNIELNIMVSGVINGILKNDMTSVIEMNEHIIENKATFKPDYVYVTDSDLNMLIQVKGNLYTEIRNKPVIKEALEKVKTTSSFVELGDQYGLIVSTPIVDSKGIVLGVYSLVALMDKERLEEITEILGEESLISLKFVEENNMDMGKSLVKGYITSSTPIYDSIWSLESEFYLEEVYKTFYIQRNNVFYIICIAAISVCIVLIVFIRLMLKRLAKATKTVRKISEGDYNTRLNISKHNYLKEFDEFSKAVNRMSGDIQNHLATIAVNYMEMVDVIINAVEINDSYTSKHNIEVGKYARIIAEEINYRNVDGIILAAKLHDIGKISIPGHILNKPGRLDKDEYEIIKTHPSEGYRIIEQIDYFQDIKLGVLHHHEHWNGSGYPHGLKGDEIPLMAQIISIADVYDAVTSKRSYHDGRSHEEACEIIIEGNGKMFNPLLVQAFIKRQDEFRKVYEENKYRR